MYLIGSIFLRFFLLGCVCFGGPAAHIGYFRKQFVERDKWLDEARFARMVALSQFLPGPGSSQVCAAIGYSKAGALGALASFLGFTLPSFVLMFVLALFSTQVMDVPLFMAVLHGLKLLAVVVVADAVWGMANSFCRTRLHWGLAIFSAVVVLLIPSMWVQCLVLLVAGVIASCYPQTPVAEVKGRLVLWPLLLFVPLLVLALWPHSGALGQIFADFFQAGALVFGGGHVVLPLLQETVGQTMDADRFLAGYAAAQAMPGPVFTLASFLGTQLYPSSPLIGAGVATLAIFLPGVLLMLGFYHYWEALASRPRIGAAAAGLNAAVVGLLLSALYQPVLTSAVLGAADMAFVILGLYVLRGRKWPILGLIALMLVIAMGRFLLISA